MPELCDLSLMAKNFKCFAEPQGFDQIKLVNVIIGRNNSGKSTLLDLVAVAFGDEVQSGMGHKGRDADVIVEWTLTQTDANAVPAAWEEFDVGGTRHRVQLKGWLQEALRDRKPRVRLSLKGSRPETVEQRTWRDHPAAVEIEQKIAQNFVKPMLHFVNKYRILRLTADRDVKPELIKYERIKSIGDGGDQATKIIHNFIDAGDRDADLIEKNVLREINVIFSPDSHFDRILTQFHRDSGLHEVYVVEENKGRVPLSRMGSGFKTVLLVVLHFLVLPKVGPADQAGKILYLFEELENNLHPSLQRRLFRWIRERALQDGHHVFVTTHSTAVIDIFADDSESQILHVEHDGESASVRTIAQFEDGLAVLADLGVKASDILQTNAVLWVEGPSDRIYLKQWIELWSAGELTEGIHYQCMFFGGSLNAHLSLDNPDGDQMRVQALRINPNAALLIDRDRDNATDSLKVHTQRLIDEVESNKGYAWVTAGREVENYIPGRILSGLLDNPKLRGPSTEFKNVLKYLSGKGHGESKVALARNVAGRLTLADLEQHLDLAKCLAELCDRIRQWNHMD